MANDEHAPATGSPDARTPHEPTGNPTRKKPRGPRKKLSEAVSTLVAAVTDGGGPSIA